MTKKDYIKLAAVMADTNPDNHPGTFESAHTSAASKKYWSHIVSKLADTLKQDNPAFNREKFIDACYGEK